jgi:6-phosphofructokinase 1
MELHFNYEVPEVLGIRYGYAGLNPARGFEPVKITEDMVEASLNDGGTILGSSRGAEDPAIMVDFLQQEQINVLLCVGGDGTQRGALAIANEVRSRNACIAVVGVPKTIDNDIMYVSRTFGFGTAIDRARDVLDSAHAESKGAPFGIGLVKLMGREAGFIAVGATLASQQVNFCLIPEVPLVLEGERGFLNILRERMVTRRHAVIAVAEGAGQDLFSETNAGQDASGNIKPRDIGAFLKTRITEHFARTGPPINLKYIDPSYYIRSVPANTSDALLCDQFARHAVHAAMAGKTALVIGFWNDRFVHVPISAAVAEKKRVRPDSEAWRSVLASTGQPASFL